MEYRQQPHPLHISLTALTITLIAAFSIISDTLASPRQSLVPGGVAIIELDGHDENTRVFFRERRVPVFSSGDNWYAMAGIGLSTKPGEYRFTIKRADDETTTSPIIIKSKKYDEQRLTIKNKRKVNPEKRDTDRIVTESKRKKTAKKHFTERTANADFIWPVTGRISSIFGLRRFFNDQERRPHSGLDIAAAEGTPIKAVADGTVIESGDFFFSGNMIYIDHGQGLISLYAHMSKIAVSKGDAIKQGQIIGNVGQTGRVTGAHLHFAVISNQTLLDPLLMLPEGGNPDATEKQEKAHNSAQNR